jgi:hypothetical protein
MEYDGIDPKIVEEEVTRTQPSESRKKEREDKIKTMLQQATNQHEMMAQSFWESHLMRNSKHTFQISSSRENEIEESK